MKDCTVCVSLSSLSEHCYVKSLILIFRGTSGRLAEGQERPSTRVLACRLKTNRMHRLCIYLFIEGLYPSPFLSLKALSAIGTLISSFVPSPLHRVTSGLFSLNQTLHKLNTIQKHAHLTNIKYINIIRKLVPSVLLL